MGGGWTITFGGDRLTCGCGCETTPEFFEAQFFTRMQFFTIRTMITTTIISPTTPETTATIKTVLTLLLVEPSQTPESQLSDWHWLAREQMLPSGSKFAEEPVPLFGCGFGFGLVVGVVGVGVGGLGGPDAKINFSFPTHTPDVNDWVLNGDPLQSYGYCLNHWRRVKVDPETVNYSRTFTTKKKWHWNMSKNDAEKTYSFHKSSR